MYICILQLDPLSLELVEICQVMILKSLILIVPLTAPQQAPLPEHDPWHEGDPLNHDSTHSSTVGSWEKQGLTFLQAR